MSERSPKLLLQDILVRIERIEEYVAGMSSHDLQTDKKTLDAVVRNFEVIGEAASQLPTRFRARYDFVEWRGVINFRNVMIHDYFEVDPELVWDTIENNLPVVKRQIRSILGRDSGSE